MRENLNDILFSRKKKKGEASGGICDKKELVLELINCRIADKNRYNDVVFNISAM